MKKRACLSISLLACAILLAYCGLRKASSTIETKQHRHGVVFKETQVHIGSVYAELTPFSASFHFTNLTDKQVELDAKACCGSRITFEGDKKVYAPAESGRIIFEITAIAKSHHGLMKKTAEVFRKHDNKPLALLTLAADIQRKWHVLPSHLNFGKLSPGQTLTASLEIQSGTREQFKVTGLSKPLPAFLKVDLASRTDLNGRMKYVYEVSITGNGREISPDQTICFQTNSSEVPEITIPLNVEMLAHVIVKPQSLFFGRVPPGTNVSKSLSVRSTCGDLLAVRSVSSTPDAVRVASLSPAKGSSIDITVLFACPPDASGIARGTLSITVNRDMKDPAGPLLFEVPWIAIIDNR